MYNLDMKRKIYNKLLDWKQSKFRKPLILEGARQTGKTYIVNIFGQNEYDNVVYCNLEQEKDISDLFNDNLIPSAIFKKIEMIKNVKINPINTLLILDEIQSTPRALTFLKYVNEQANDYHIIATGSLLGIALHRQQASYPVGKVNVMKLYPMDFEEFLMVYKRDDLIEEIKTCFKNNTPINNALHQQLLDIYKTYLFVGGMPEVVSKFVETKNNNLVRLTQHSIIDSYLKDMAKYNSEHNAAKTRLIYSKISSQLSKQNKKFKYSELKHGARSKDYEYALNWICLTGLAFKIKCLKQIQLPFNDYCLDETFKLYSNDCGLLGNQKDISYEEICNDRIINYFKGGFVENYVFCQLIVNGFKPYYWVSDGIAEIDFLLKINNKAIPVEVKSSDNTKSKSLNVYIDRYKPAYSIRISAKNFGFENNIKSIPLYAVFCLKDE